MGATATAEGFPEANTVSLIGNDPWDSVSTLVETRHDLLNALAVIHGYEQLLRHRLGQSAEPKDLQALDAIRSNISRAVQLLRPPDHAPVSRCDLEVLLEQARYGVPPERYIDITVHVAGGEPVVGYWRQETITRVLANVLHNAAKYSISGTPIRVVVTQAGESAYIEVQDQGIAIEADELEAIFEGHRTATARRVAHGTGVGLRLCRRLVRLEGGRLWAESAPGKGTSFYIDLPLNRPGNLGGPISCTEM